jgi:hypothetical protein
VLIRSGRTGAQEMSCGYQLERREADDAFTGSSTCAGMPQETRLEIGGGVRALMAPQELALFLVAALASPPLATHEWR